ncbi:MAG: tryptophan synthase subunit alpha [candidate division WOR-3 bacterium]
MMGSSKIQEKFKELKEKNEMALILYVTGGFPNLGESMKIIKTLSKSGADIIEIGIPFSDPIADGPTIQHSSQISLTKGTTLKKILSAVKKLKVNVPLVFMSYLNPLLAYGQEKFIKDMKDSGVSGLIIPDLPVEEASEWISLSKEYETELIFLLTPTSPLNRRKKIVSVSRGFVYCVTVTGTTGIRERLPSYLDKFLKEVKKLTDLPIAVGFGISTPEQIKMLHGKADGVILGSRIIEAIINKENLIDLTRQLKEATKL